MLRNWRVGEGVGGGGLFAIIVFFSSSFLLGGCGLRGSEFLFFGSVADELCFSFSCGGLLRKTCGFCPCADSLGILCSFSQVGYLFRRDHSLARWAGEGVVICPHA